jgi:hypothetical protein
VAVIGKKRKENGWGILENKTATCPFCRGKMPLDNMPSRYSRNLLLVLYVLENAPLKIIPRVILVNKVCPLV